jgi:hypothetical protein
MVGHRYEIQLLKKFGLVKGVFKRWNWHCFSDRRETMTSPTVPSEESAEVLTSARGVTVFIERGPVAGTQI